LKVVVIGIDGGNLDLIRKWVGEGKLPNMAKLIEGGTSGYLETIFPPLTGPAWVSFMTGVNPGKHGVYDFMTQEVKEGISIISSESIKVPVLWDFLGKKDIRSVVVNVPITYPPTPLNGCILTGTLSGRGDISYPPELIDEVESAIGRKYRTSLSVGPQLGKEDDYIEDFVDWHKSIEEASLYLLKAKDWDFYMTVFGITDGFSHHFWRKMEEGLEYGQNILKAYSLVDEAIGKILENLDSETDVILMSDHGFGSLKKMVNLNLYLMDKGHVVLRKKSLLKSFLLRHGITANNFYKLLQKLGVAHMVKKVSLQTQSRFLDMFLSFDDVNWQKTMAYSRGHVGQIYLNAIAIEERGFEFFDFRERLIGELYEMIDERTGEKFVDKVIKREDLYWGNYADQGPELFIIMKNFSYLCYPLFAADNKLVTDHIMKHRTGTHRMNGMFVAQGPSFPEGREIEDARIFDVAPTIMKIMGVDIPDYIDGVDLAEIARGKHISGSGTSAQEDGGD
jgi:predicted AlkP superfamily phosphohydrolase/phosphomutase